MKEDNREMERRDSWVKAVGEWKTERKRERATLLRGEIIKLHSDRDIPDGAYSGFSATTYLANSRGSRARAHSTAE